MIAGTVRYSAAMLLMRLAQPHCWFGCAEIAQEHLGQVAQVTPAGNPICLQELSPDSKMEMT